jgi:6-phosphogluconolactonase (cycloisomerase 2 family)
MNIAIRRSPCALIPALLLAGCSSANPTESVETASAAIIAAPGAVAGAVFTQTNAAEGNELVEYARAPGGALTLSGRFATGGAGLGTGLSAQGALAREGRWLFVVNAGSSDVSTFDLAQDPPRLASRVPSGGTQPVSVTARNGIVYVLDAGGAGNIAGFRLDPGGMLNAIAGSVRPLSGASVTPTQVAFSPDGDTLIVTEKGDNQIDAYYVDVAGRAEGPVVNPSNGAAPFGFDFSPRGELIVSEAAASAASAYAVLGEVHLASISASVANTQSAACWLVVSPDGSVAFTANAGSGTLSSYRIERGGALALESAVAGSTGVGSHPVDMAFDATGRHLYALANGAGTITAFEASGGHLANIGAVDSLPTSATGLVAW